MKLADIVKEEPAGLGGRLVTKVRERDIFVRQSVSVRLVEP